MIPLVVSLLILWIVSADKFFGQLLGLIFSGILGIGLLITTIQFFFSKKDLQRDDICGEYVIDRTKFPGKQADWQYDHFRFEITKENKFLFHITEGDVIHKTDTGKVVFLEACQRPRIILQVAPPRHHIIEDKPTLYSASVLFYYVFHSPRFGNVFFTKGKWTDRNNNERK
jgi:hypothetical protein